MHNKTTYLSELEALRAENTQLSEWHRDLQEKYLKQGRELKLLVAYIERQAGATYLGRGVFERQHNASEDYFTILTNGKVIGSLCKL